MCALCGGPIVWGLGRDSPLGPSLDHVIPLSRGGHPTAMSNLQPAHFGCNASKGDRQSPGGEDVTSEDWFG